MVSDKQFTRLLEFIQLYDTYMYMNKTHYKYIFVFTTYLNYTLAWMSYSPCNSSMITMFTWNSLISLFFSLQYFSWWSRYNTAIKYLVTVPKYRMRVSSQHFRCHVLGTMADWLLRDFKGLHWSHFANIQSPNSKFWATLVSNNFVKIKSTGLDNFIKLQTCCKY